MTTDEKKGSYLIVTNYSIEAVKENETRKGSAKTVIIGMASHQARSRHSVSWDYYLMM